MNTYQANRVSACGACLAATLVALVLAGAASATDVIVQPLAGQKFEGELNALTEAKIVLRTVTGEQALDLKEVQSLEFSPAPTTDKPSVWLELVDGSQLLGLSFQASNGQAKVELLGSVQIQLPTRSIRWVRFREQDSSLAEQWATINKGVPTGDLLVIRKTSVQPVEQPGQEPRPATTALDELDGTVLEVGPSSAKFEFGGDVIDVNREKIEGIVYFHPVKRELPPASCRVVDASRSVWTARSIELKGDHLNLVSTAGVSISLQLGQVWQIDFSSGNVKFLGELEEESSLSDASFQPRNMTATFKQLRAPRKDRPFGGEGLSIGGDKFARGLSLASRTRIAYRVPEGMRWFRASAGLDDTAGPAANLTLTMLADNREIYRRTFSADDPDRKAVPIVVELAGAQRLTLVVEEGSGLDIADQLDLAEAKFTK